MVTGDTILDAVESFREHIESNDIASDGLVLTFDSISYSQSLGRTAKMPQRLHCFQMGRRNGGNHLREIEWNTFPYRAYESHCGF